MVEIGQNSSRRRRGNSLWMRGREGRTLMDGEQPGPVEDNRGLRPTEIQDHMEF